MTPPKRSPAPPIASRNEAAAAATAACLQRGTRGRLTALSLAVASLGVGQGEQLAEFCVGGGGFPFIIRHTNDIFGLRKNVGGKKCVAYTQHIGHASMETFLTTIDFFFF